MKKIYIGNWIVTKCWVIDCGWSGYLLATCNKGLISFRTNRLVREAVFKKTNIVRKRRLTALGKARGDTSPRTHTHTYSRSRPHSWLNTNTTHHLALLFLLMYFQMAKWPIHQRRARRIPPRNRAQPK